MSTRRRPPRRRGGSDLVLRVLWAIPAIAYAIFIIAGGGWIFAVGILVLGFVCLHELYRMYESLRPVRLAGFLGIAGLAVACDGGWRAPGAAGPRGLHPGALPARSRAAAARRLDPHGGMSITTFGVVWVGMAIAHAILLRETAHGDGIIVDILVGTFLGDTCAYLGGRWFGTRKLAPRVSPNKTVEGLVFGFLGAVLFTWAAGLYQDWLSGTDALLLGVAVGLVAPLGDLMESAIKRDAGTKDAGTLFGAHGGALDRLDAAFFTLVAGYYVWLALM